MANKTICQTPGAQFHTQIKPNVISCKVDLPFELKLTPEQAKILDTNIHNVMELVLAPYFAEKTS